MGGHSIDDNEPKYGLSVTGFVHPDQYWTNVGARVGDKLILTKPIGVGIITTALRAGHQDLLVEKAAIESMAALNRQASEIGRKVGIRACTDVTGFGLLGHLREMLEGVGVRVRLSAVPLLKGVRELAEADFVPGGTYRNRDAVRSYVEFDPSVGEIDQLLLCDAQTSGGLLFAVAQEKAIELLEQLRGSDIQAAEIGEFIYSNGKHIEVMD